MSLEMNHQQIHVIFCMMVQKGLLGIFWLATLLHDSIRKRIQANRGGDGYLKTKSSRMSLNAWKKNRHCSLEIQKHDPQLPTRGSIQTVAHRKGHSFPSSASGILPNHFVRVR